MAKKTIPARTTGRGGEGGSYLNREGTSGKGDTEAPMRFYSENGERGGGATPSDKSDGSSGPELEDRGSTPTKGYSKGGVVEAKPKNRYHKGSAICRGPHSK